jgi:phosphate:Na+ symporter
MTATPMLLQILGQVALLLWGLHMVQTGLMRAFGAGLRATLAAGTGSRAKAFLAGLGVTALLQSSTATGLMAAGFAASGAIELVPALALMLGANVGTTLIVQALAFDMSEVAPLLLLGGLVAFRRGARSRTRDMGKAAIGLGLMLLSLHLLVGTLIPAERPPALRELLGVFAADPVLAMLAAAAVTWAAHSSAATVLLAASLAEAGVVAPVAALFMVAGANLGSAVNPLVEGPSDNPAARRLAVGNLMNRAVGCAAVLALAGPLGRAAAGIEAAGIGAGTATAGFHVAFNLALAAAFILPLPALARLLVRLLPERVPVADPAAPRHLDPAALAVPHLAIAGAAREALRMSDTADAMLRGALEVFRTDDRRLVAEVRAMDDVLDRLHEAIKRYLLRINPDDLEEEDAHRLSEVLGFTINLEHVGDIVDKNLMEAAARKIERRVAFPDEVRAEVTEALERLIDTGNLAASVFVSGDVRAARALLRTKEAMRDVETRATQGHLDRLRAGKAGGAETSTLQLDILRDLRRINAHFAAASYPILDRSGELRPSRLRDRAG